MQEISVSPEIARGSSASPAIALTAIAGFKSALPEFAVG